MNRTLLQELAEERVRDAAALLGASQWSGAYYLSGYAIECGLKASIAKYTDQYDFPDRAFAQSCYTHDLKVLIIIADLKKQLEADARIKPALGVNWAIVKDWDEKSRYRRWTELQARQLFAAVDDQNDGVMSWLRMHY